MDNDRATLRQLPEKYLRAIRKSLMLSLPIVFIGAIALLLGSFPYAVVLPPGASPIGEEWRALALLVWRASSGIMALALLLFVSHFLSVEARDRQLIEISPPLVAVLALVNFFVVSRFPDMSSGLWLLGPQSVLLAIAVAIGSCELFVACTRLGWLRLGRKTYDLNPSLHLALTAIGPALATVSVFALASQAGSHLSFDLSHSVAQALLAIDAATGSGLPGLLLLGMFNQLLWFVGLHGSYLMQNVSDALFAVPAAASGLPEVSDRLISHYAHLGGSGATLGLLLAIALLARRSESSRIAGYALLPSLFNINEVVLFGLPIIFNPIYLVPFVAAPLVLVSLSYFCLSHGWIALDVTPIPWVTPPLLGGAVNSGSWHGAALQAANIVVSALIYAPFVRIAMRRRANEDRATLTRVVADIERIKLQHASVLNRHDELGHAARKLLHEFVDDLGSERVYLAYQPQHDSSGRVVGVEALLRWQHRHHGAISPSVVCALLEESQRIIPFGRWAISTACRQLHSWKQAGIEALRVSINVSPMQLRDAGLVAHIAGCLRDCQLTASEIGLEITESQHVPDDSVSLTTLKGLEALGLALEMDDFGMGYSSMLYIRRFRFAAIKLDGVLTRDVVQDRNCREIIASVVRLGAASQIRVVAEYVETREQQRVLAELGCNEFQGNLYSQPLAASEGLDYLRRHAAGGAA